MVQPRGELAGLLTAESPKTRLSEMALDPATRARIERVLAEQRDRAHIRAHGLAPIRRLLLVGAPGTGKTMTASVLACELSLPLFSINLHGLIAKYLGETVAKLRLIFDSIHETRAVYLFDKFDRPAKNEVGEIRRVLNSFVRFLEHDLEHDTFDSDSIVVAATNHPSLLASHRHRMRENGPFILALALRRFDSMIEYTDVAKISHAELASACETAAKNAIMARRTTLSTAEIVSALKRDRRADQSEPRTEKETQCLNHASN